MAAAAGAPGVGIPVVASGADTARGAADRMLLKAAPSTKVGAAAGAPGVGIFPSFPPACRPMRDPPRAGWHRWSSPATWGRKDGGVPGVGRLRGANVTIPCWKGVLLDVPDLHLHTLLIAGFLKVFDPPRPVRYTLGASFIVVRGQLSIGYANAQFRSKITITLLPNPHGRQPLVRNVGGYSANLGHKAFAVVGGRVSMHGVPGGTKTVPWTVLSGYAPAGARQIRVVGDVRGKWPIGATVAVASSDYTPMHSERHVIVGYGPKQRGATVLRLKKPLRFNHYGSFVPDSFGGTIDERAEVALLSRNIVIRGAAEKKPHGLEGGHFVVFMTASPQQIEGVEFVNMGQQGTLGRYPIHFHVCGDTKGRSVVRANSIHDSKQRCVVLHATHRVRVLFNVAFNTQGHCYMVEEGGEQGNAFVRNLGMLTRRVSRKIPLNPTAPAVSEETDDQPATFWISNMGNTYRGNVAAGSEDSGFWAELRPGVRGMSLFIDSMRTVAPMASRAGIFAENTAHSNRVSGVRFYPHGYFPPSPTTFWGFRIYKHASAGLALFETENITLARGKFADNLLGVHLQQGANIRVQDSSFVALSPNLGTPPPRWRCATKSGPFYCAPVAGCQLPLRSKAPIRAMGGTAHWRTPSFGLALAPYRSTQQRNNVFINNRFSNYRPECRPAAAVGVGISRVNQDWWSAGTFFQRLRIQAGSLPVWFATPEVNLLNGTQQWDAGAAVNGIVLWDKDGSLMGGKGGFLLPSGKPALQPPPAERRVRNGKGKGKLVAAPPCHLIPGARAVGCPGVCYRTILVAYPEPGFVPLTDGGRDQRTHKDFSYLSIRRKADGAVFTSTGDDNHVFKSTERSTAELGRWFFINLYAPATYSITIVPPKANRRFRPGLVQVMYADGNAHCASGVKLQFRNAGRVLNVATRPNYAGLFLHVPRPHLSYSE